MTVNRRMAKSHGYYLQHAKEVCLVGKKGSDPPGTRKCVGSDIIYSERRGQSQKPEEIYQLIEELVPNGTFACSYMHLRQLQDCIDAVQMHAAHACLDSSRLLELLSAMQANTLRYLAAKTTCTTTG